MNGISAFIREAPENTLAPPTICGHENKMAICKPGEPPVLNVTMPVP